MNNGKGRRSLLLLMLFEIGSNRASKEPSKFSAYTRIRWEKCAAFHQQTIMYFCMLHQGAEGYIWAQ
jgi:hypothetical protein